MATVFGLAGLTIATWMSRIPQVRDNLDLTPGELGRLLLALAAGSVLSLPTAGLVTNRIGPARAATAGGVLAGLGLVLAGWGGGPLTSVAVVALGLFVAGYGHGLADVAMNVAAAALERRLGRSLMPRLHGAFSVGTVAGAGFGAGLAAFSVPVVAHLSVVGLLAVGLVPVAATRFPPPDPVEGASEAQPAGGPDPAGRPSPVRPARPRLRAAWLEPRTVLIGVLVLTFALSEGTAYDWLAVGLVDGIGVSNAVGAFGFAVFVVAMTVGRFAGTAALDRFGRVPVLRASAVLVIGGVALVAFSSSLPVALAGAVAWGAGTALGFPVGMSAAADDPPWAAVRVSVVASVAYTAFLAGPPLLGTLGDQLGVQRAMLVVVGAMAVAALVAASARPLPAATPTRPTARV